MVYRISLLIGAISVAFFVLAFHVYELQITKGDFYLAKAENQAAVAESTSGNRGTISFTEADGTLLPAAIEKQFPLVYAVPVKIDDAAEAANLVAPILGVQAATLEALFSKPGDQYELLARKADVNVAQQITELKLKGVYADYAPDRFYPLDLIAAQVLGYVGPNATTNGESGHYGVEGYYDSTLAQGDEVTLTIDPNIQIEAEKILDDLVARNGATGGSIIVEDPKTGAILAMAGYPTFDPNNYGVFPVSNFLNPTVQEVYEPGSIFKVLTMAAGIESGTVTPDSTYNDVGYVNINKAHITNYDLATHGPYGPGTTMTEVIEHSINTGAIYVENKVGNDAFTAFIKKFHLDQKTGIDLPGEVIGNLSELNPKSRQVAFDTAAYGQGVAVTPIGLITAIDALANGGVMMKPRVNASTKAQALGIVMSATTAKTVAQMMVGAVDHAGVANIEGYSLAGKTGSAFIPDLVHGGYTDKLIDSYVGFGPTSDPRFIALIRLNTLPSTALAAQSVVPAFKTLSQYIINYYHVPPDRLDAVQ